MVFAINNFLSFFFYKNLLFITKHKCYDLRFPQLSSILTKNLGAQILTYPSVFTIPTGEAHWYLKFFLVIF